MNPYKEYLQLLRKEELDLMYLQILNDLSPEMVNIVKLICNVKYSVFDGDLHTFYTDIKKVVTVYIAFWNESMDKAIKEADKYCGTVTKENILSLIEKTLDIHQSKQIAFGKEYLPVSKLEERKIYEDIEAKYQQYFERLQEMRDRVEQFDKPNLSVDFIKENMEISKKKTYDIFVFTHKYIATLLADQHLPQIRSSLNEIISRVRSNLRNLQDHSNETVNGLLNELYDQNKEHLQLCRQDRKSSVALAEISKTIEKLRNRIEENSNIDAIDRLKEELYYWEYKKADIDDSAALIDKLKGELNNISEQERIYESLNCQEIPVPGSRNRCWKITGDNLKERRELLKTKIMEAKQVLVTHFGTRGPNHKLYTDENGKFYIDEYNHQVYLFEHGLKEYHVTCDGTLKETNNNEMPGHDHFGRYILNEKGGKVYQRAPCGSSYQLDDNDLMVKTDVDCGHSDEANKKCRVEMKDPSETVILPKREEVNIKESLEPEVVKYLWDTFGPLLHHALYDVGKLQPQNPIHCLAHRILAHKYGRTGDELEVKSKEAGEYRANIYKDRKEKAIARTKAWKAQFPKPVKAEELDDAEMRAAIDAQRAANEFTIQLGYFD